MDKVSQIPIFAANSGFLTDPMLTNILKGLRYAARRKRAGVFLTASFDELAAFCDRGKLRAAIALEYSMADARENVRLFHDRKLHPIYMNIRPDSDFPFSSVIWDSRKEARHIARYCISEGAKRMACVGRNPDSFPDRERLDGIRDAAEGSGVSLAVFENEGRLSDCINECVARADEFDTFLCVNDYVAYRLFKSLKQPMPQKIVSFGDTALSKSITSLISVNTQNFRLAEHTAGLCLTMEKNPEIGSVQMLVSFGDGAADDGSDIVAGKVGPGREIDFFKDDDVKALSRLEIFASTCDDVDRAILAAVARGESYEQIEDEQYIHSSTVKYRIGKMKRLTGVSDISQLIDILHMFGEDFARPAGR